MSAETRRDQQGSSGQAAAGEGHGQGWRVRAQRLAGGVLAAWEVLSQVPPRQRLLVVGGLFLSGVFELFGLWMIVPLLASVSGGREGKAGLVAALRTAVEAVGLPFHPATFLGLIVLGLTLKSATTIAVMRYVGELVPRIGRETQLRIVRGLLQARWGFYIRQPLGRLINATGSESAAGGECFLVLARILAALLETCLFLTVAAFISVELAALTLALAVLMFVSFARFVRQSREADREHRRKVRKMGSSLTDALAGIKPLRAMARTDRFTRSFERDAAELADALRKRVLSSEYASELQEPIVGTIVAVGFLYAATTASLAPHELVIMGILLVRTIKSVRPVQRGTRRFFQSYDQYRSLNRFLAEVEHAADVRHGCATPRFEEALTLEDVTFAHGRRGVLEGFSLAVPRGRITTLAGRSGAGKSTVVDLVTGLHRPAAGRVAVDGEDLATLDLTAWRRMIGYVPQDVTLFHASILDNVSLWEEGATEEDVAAALVAAGAWPFVEALEEGVAYDVGERGQRLSGGQRQRIAIARALLFRPRLLIVDEATTGLDEATERGICATVRRLCDEEGLTVLAVSHQAAWRAVADQVCRIADDGTVEVTPGGAADPAAPPRPQADLGEDAGAEALGAVS
jgi:ATP-binding cassette, subfamily C, bacterial